jgi:hypothetical protein
MRMERGWKEDGMRGVRASKRQVRGYKDRVKGW